MFVRIVLECSGNRNSDFRKYLYLYIYINISQLLSVCLFVCLFLNPNSYLQICLYLFIYGVNQESKQISNLSQKRVSTVIMG